MIVTTSHVKQHLGTIAPEMIGHCFKCTDLSTGENFYKVESEEVKFDGEGQRVEYTVRYQRGKGFTCTCPAGKEGFRFVKHPSKVCKHVRWSVAAAMEEKQAMAQLALASAQQALEESKPALPTVTPMKDWTAAERRDYRMNKQREQAIDGLLASLEMARNPQNRY